MARTKDMTVGSPITLILFFALPIFAGNMLQQLYNLVDSLIVGRLLGVTALTAVSASGWLDWTVLSIPMGLAQGFSIQAAQSFGAGNTPQLRRTAGQSVLLAVIVTILLEILSQFLLAPALFWMNTPEETFRLTENYLRIIYAGLPVVMAVNVLNGFLQALGDSHTPLLALAAASVVNIVLDWIFVGPLGMGTNGGAYATVIAQAVSSLVSFLAIKKMPIIHPTKEDLHPDRKMIRKLIRLGAPIAFQNVVISIGGLVLQGVINGFGFIFMAGYNAAARLQGIVEISGSSLGSAVGTFTGQNIGAGKKNRVRQGLRSSAQIGFGMAALIGGTLFFLGRPLLSLFLQDEQALVDQVLAVGYRFLCYMAVGLPSLYLLFVYRSTLQGLGNTIIPMISGFVELGMRVGCALLLPRFFGEAGIYFSEIAAWIGAAGLLICGYYREIKR